MATPILKLGIPSHLHMPVVLAFVSATGHINEKEFRGHSPNTLLCDGISGHTIHFSEISENMASFYPVMDFSIMAELEVISSD